MFSTPSIAGVHSNAGVHLEPVRVATPPGGTSAVHVVVGGGTEPVVERRFGLRVLAEIAVPPEPSREPTMDLVLELGDIVGRRTGIDTKLDLVVVVELDIEPGRVPELRGVPLRSRAEVGCPAMPSWRSRAATSSPSATTRKRIDVRGLDVFQRMQETTPERVRLVGMSERRRHAQQRADV